MAMKAFYPLAMGLLLALSLHLAAAQSTDGCIAKGAFDPSVNYFSTAFANDAFALPISIGTNIQNAYNFTVEYKNFYKIARDMHTGSTYVLYLCGAPNPSSLLTGIAVNGFFEIPLRSYGMVTTVPANYLQLLGVVPGLQKGEDAVVVDACMQKVVQGLSPPANSDLPMVNADFFGPWNSPNISFSASQDLGILNRAEWIKYLALFFNKEEQAQKVFSDISAQYGCLKARVPQNEAKPTVAWLGFFDGAWTLSDTKYKMQLVEDAGGVNADTSTLFFNMSIPDDVTKLQALLQSVDVVLDETYLPKGPAAYSMTNFTENAQLTEAQAGDLVHNVWSIYGQYADAPIPATAWYESAISQPQVVLSDILSILHPSLFAPEFTPTYFYNVHMGKATLVTAADCMSTDPAAEVAPTNVASGCALQAPTTSPPAEGTLSMASSSASLVLLAVIACMLLV